MLNLSNYKMNTRSKTKMAKKTYKLILVGDGGVGKTQFTHGKMGMDFDNRYVATLGVEVHPVEHSNVVFNVWDTAGQEKFGGLGDGYYIQSQCCIVMCDASSKLSIKSLPNWVRAVKRVCEDIPLAIVCNKMELENDGANLPKEILGYPLFQCSVKNNEGIDEVFEYLHGQLKK